MSEFLSTEYHKALTVSNTTTITFMKQPNIVGYYVLGQGDGWNTKLAMRRKPSWLARFCMRHFFDIRWEDVK